MNLAAERVGHAWTSFTQDVSVPVLPKTCSKAPPNGSTPPSTVVPALTETGAWLDSSWTVTDPNRPV